MNKLDIYNQCVQISKLNIDEDKRAELINGITMSDINNLDKQQMTLLQEMCHLETPTSLIDKPHLKKISKEKIPPVIIAFLEWWNS